jgi:hypothetical protein
VSRTLVSFLLTIKNDTVGCPAAPRKGCSLEVRVWMDGVLAPDRVASA